MMVRNSYSRSRSRSRNRSKPKVIIPLAAGDYLHECGYKLSQPSAERRKRLDRAVRAHSYKDIVLRMNATAIRIKNNAPESSQKIRKDMAWLKKKYRS